MSRLSPTSTRDINAEGLAPSSDVHPGDAVRSLLTLACRIVQGDGACLWPGEGNPPLGVDASGEALPEGTLTTPLIDLAAAQVRSQSALVTVEDTHSHEDFQETAASEHDTLRAFLALPLCDRGECVDILERSESNGTENQGSSVLCVFVREPRSWSAEDRAALRYVAEALDAHLASHRHLRHRLDQTEQAHAVKHSLLDATSEGIYGVDLHGNCFFCNKACAQLLGYDDPEELLGKNMHALIHHTRADGTLYPIEECTIYQAFHERRSIHVEQDIFWRKDGSFFPVEFWSDPIFWEGKVAGAALSFIDIAQRLNSQHALRRSEEQRRLALDAGQLGTWDFDIATNTVFWDERCRHVFGLSNQETVSLEDALAVMHPDDRDMVEAAILYAMDPATSGDYNEDYRVVWPDGTERWVSARGKVYFSHDGPDRQPVRFTGILFDNTQRKHAEAALQEAEERYRFLANTIPQQVWTAQANGKLEYVNKVVLDHFGRSFEEMIGEGWLNVVHPDDLERCIERWTHSLETGDPYEFEFRLLHKDGSYRWHLARAHPQRNAAGTIVNWFGSNTDIHDFREVQDALRRSEEQRRIALQASDMGTWDYDLLTGTIYWDERCRAIAGVTEDSPIDYNRALSLTHPDDRERINAAVEHATDPSTPDNFQEDYRVVWPDGSVHWVSARGQVYFDGDGPDRRPVRFVGINFDISERKWMEHLIQAQKEILERIIHDDPLPEVMQQLIRAIETQSVDKVMATVLLLDEDGQHLRYCASNPLLDDYNRTIDGLAIGPNVGSCGSAAYHRETVIVSDIATDPRWADFRDLASAHRLAACWSVPILAADNRVLGTFAVYHRKPSAPRAKDLNLIHVMADTASIAIERQRNQDALTELNATLERRVMKRTAEVRALASELTRIEQRERKRISQLLHDHLQQRLYGIRIQLRDADKIDAAERANRRQKVDALLRESIDITRTLSVELSPPVLHEDGLAAALGWLAQQMEEVHDLAVALDVEGSGELEDQELSVLLFQLVRELLFNTVKHAGVKEASVQLRFLPDRLELAISDKGVGFDVEHMRHRRRSVGGMGLRSIRERLELFGGTLHVDSAPGQGTRTEIMLPRQTVPTSSSSAPGNGLRILVIDDSEAMHQAYADLIGSADDMDIFAGVTTAADALEAFDRGIPDLAIVDVSLPDMSGVSLVKHLASTYPDLPMIMISGYSDQMFRSKALKAGARDYMEKDAILDQLLPRIRTLLQEVVQ